MHKLAVSLATVCPNFLARYSKCHFSGTGLTSEEFMKKSQNEPVLTYKKGSSERIALEKAISELANTTTDVPLRIGSERIYNNLEEKQVMVRKFACLRSRMHKLLF